MNKCYTHFNDIGRFITNVGDNWRNSIYITCSACKYKKESCCDDLLVSFDNIGTPAIIMVNDANYIFGSIMDKSEFLCEMSNVKFEAIYQKFLQKNIDGKISVCPLLQIVNREKSPTFREKVGNWLIFKQLSLATYFKLIIFVFKINNENAIMRIACERR